MPQASQIQCPKCSSSLIIKKGVRKNKLQALQQYQCKNCKYIFTQNKSKNTTYPISTILKAISAYNLGHTLQETKEKLNLDATLPAISSWLNKYKEICTFHRLRKQAIKLYKPKNIIFKKPLKHQQVYLFQIHKAKLELLSKEEENKKFLPIKEYLSKIPTEEFPHHIFSKELLAERGIEVKIDSSAEQRISQLKLETLPTIKIEKNNHANKLAELSLKTSSNNNQRHQAIQNFMLVNDSTTIAVEVPVYLTKDDIKYFKDRKFKIDLENYATPITGHIDILQIRNGLLHILDYKPDADKINPVEQLTIYALALASRTKLALRDFKCAWFDENSYFEFFPLHAVYEKSVNKNLVMVKWKKF